MCTTWDAVAGTVRKLMHTKRIGYFRVAFNLCLKVRLSAKMSFHLLTDKTHFHIKEFTLDLALKERQNATQKWPIEA